MLETHPYCRYLLVWDYLPSPAKNLSFFAGYLRLAMYTTPVVGLMISSSFHRGLNRKKGIRINRDGSKPIITIFWEINIH